MKVKKILSIIMAIILLFGLVSCGDLLPSEDTAAPIGSDTESNIGSETETETETETDPVQGNEPDPPVATGGNGVIEGFIKADGQLLVDEDGDQFLIKGIAFSNDAGWEGRTTPPTTYHDESSYQEVKELGFNSVRFYLSYKFFESDSNPYTYKESAWTWLDQHIEWAKANDIRLILNMHTPQGGYQSVGEGLELWTNVENQNRLTALWKEIARRYKDESTIIGFGLVNEPIMPWLGDSETTLEQWRSLAQRITDAIRTVDTNHIIFVERAISARDMNNGNQTMALDEKFVLVNDNNVVYEYHDYSPSMLTHQGMDWNGTVGNYAEYPNDNKQYGRDPDIGTWLGTTTANSRMNVDNSNESWQYFEGSNEYKLPTSNFNLGTITIMAGNIGENGVVYVDDIEVLEYDENGALLGTIATYSFSQDTKFQYWKGETGGGGEVSYSSNVGHSQSGSMKISGTTKSGAKAFDNYNMLYTTKGHSYQIKGWIKCENVDANAKVYLTIDYYKTENAMPRNKDTLEKELLEYIQFGIDNNVPMYLGEFGTSVPSFSNNLGGDRWVEDMMSLLTKYNVNFNYHTYIEPNVAFGLYTGFDDAGNRTNYNQVLADTFKRFLTGNSE